MGITVNPEKNIAIYNKTSHYIYRQTLVNEHKIELKTVSKIMINLNFLSILSLFTMYPWKNAPENPPMQTHVIETILLPTSKVSRIRPMFTSVYVDCDSITIYRRIIIV